MGGICNYPGCGGLGEPCCINNACHGSLECIDNRCRYTGSDYGTCGNLYRDINGPLEGGKLYVVDQQGIPEDDIRRRYPVVLLVHGMGSDCSAWTNYLQWFRNKGYRIGNVSLYRHESEHSQVPTYEMFNPNGQMLLELSDSLKAYMEIMYPDSLGWNNNIVAVAHSRGGLDAENAIVLKGADMKGIVSLATPWFGSKLADVCVSGVPPSGRCDEICLLTLPALPAYFKCLAICLAVSEITSYVCTRMLPDSRILTTWDVSRYRNSITSAIQNSPIKYAAGIGYTRNLLCGGFNGKNIVTCFLLKYFFFEWANDGMVQGNSVYRMNHIFGDSKFELISPECPNMFNCPSPGMWVVDHSAVRESYDIFNNEVELKVRDIGGNQNSTTSGGVDYQALMEAMREVRITRSAGYITYLSGGDTLHLRIGRNLGISGIAILSQSMLQGINMDYCDTCLYKYSYESASKDLYREITLRAVDSGSVIIGFILDSEEALMEMERDRIRYREGDSAILTLRLPKDEYQITAYYTNADRMEGGDIQFVNNRAVIRNLREGIYMVGVQIEGRTYRRTLIMYFPVEEREPSGKSMGYKETLPELSEGIYKVYDLSGRLIYRGYTSGGKVSLEHLNLRKGVYIVKQGKKTYKVMVK